MNRVHCMFEQSGTFKNEFKKLGFLSYDYDILNDFNETDFQIDLFNEIEKAYNDKSSIFDSITQDDLIMAFFPCIRFEDQIQMAFRGTQKQLIDKPLETKLAYDLKLHEELHELYGLVTKLVIVCLRKRLRLIIENPYSSTHYLTKYWCIKPKVIDTDRTIRGDYFIKPTQFWFVNLEPKQNMIWEAQAWNKAEKSVKYTGNKVMRSMISKDYANRFIREFII